MGTEPYLTSMVRSGGIEIVVGERGDVVGVNIASVLRHLGIIRIRRLAKIITNKGLEEVFFT